MAKFSIAAAVVVAVIILGGAIFLATWNVPAPTTHVEKPVADDKLPR